MTEVDAVMPEGVSSVPIIPQSNNTTINESNGDDAIDNVKQLKENQSIDAKQINNESLDGTETEEDDSQITSSTENGCESENAKNAAINFEGTSIASSKSSKTFNNQLDHNDKTVDSEDSLEDSASNELPQNCETLNDRLDVDSQDSVPSSAHKSSNGDPNSMDDLQSESKADSTNFNNHENSDSTAASNNDEDTVTDSITLNSNNDEEFIADSVTTKELKSDSGKIVDTTISAVKEDKDVQKRPAQQENGIHNMNKQDNNTSIVDLDDDSDVEMTDVSKVVDPLASPEKPINCSTDSTNNANNVKPQSNNDSDNAVIINSDSETELIPTDSTKPLSQPKTTQIDDDDDDDCVVIEDDDVPTPLSNDASKRKNEIINLTNVDELQPPSKRQRVTPQTNNTCQIAIKDPRSLMVPDLSNKRLSDNIYPVNITPATAPVPNATQGPPKLVPMVNPSNFPFTGLPNLNAIHSLPGLTDDMFVLEAPSFIVPYIYEKPPADQLKDVVKLIENKYDISKEDLAEADKADEFDMMTEQNKEDRPGKIDKKKKRRRDGDESWSEESEEDDDDDDDDSESGLRTKVLIKEVQDDLTVLSSAIKPASAVVASPTTNANTMAKPGQENYFESPLGKFFMDIGVGLVQEFVQSDLLRLQKRKMRKSLGKNITEFERAIHALSANLEASKKKNTPFKFTMKRCEFCTFKSESALAMANHYETPHMNGVLYKCNFCPYEIRNATEIVYHMEAIHNIKARLIKPLPYHQCANCGFEDNGKAKLARHLPVCVKKFRPEINLAPPNDWEAPAKIPRIKPRHGLVGTATAYQAMAAQAAAQKAALASIQQQQQQVAQARSIQAAALAAQNAAKARARPQPMPKPTPNNNPPNMRGSNMARNPICTNVVLPTNYQFSSQLIPTSPATGKKNTTGQPSISITPLPRQSTSAQSSPSTNMKMPPAGMKPGQSPTGGNKTQFVICEICDGYIKDLEQLRNHMQWMHKVKIHPKMIYNRPPLNCQKCQFRFFTDQGLERHLLGSHGLVTSSMQEAANKGKDAGRCPVCGRMYQWKLLNHVSRDHHMTLKPAHLSYKCTVCTATFGMYKQFETHVYTAHSTVAKKAMDNKKNNSSPTAASGSNNQRGSFGAANDSLLKPLKINDEITIIPQPASKSRISNMESHIID